MKRTLFLSALFFVLMPIFSVQVVWGQIPQTMSYQGVLTNAKGTLVADGKYTITFKLYTDSEGGTALWSETRTVVVKNGLFNVTLGSANPLDVAFDKQYWLGITVGEGSEVSQRMQLTSSAYSLHARTVADSAITRSKIASGQVVRSINAMTDDVTLAAGENVTISQKGHALVISASVGTDDKGAVAPKSDMLIKKVKPKKFWEIEGNAGTDPATNFLGTTDNQPLVIRTNDAEAMRIDATGNVGIGTTNPQAALDLDGDQINAGNIWVHDGTNLLGWINHSFMPDRLNIFAGNGRQLSLGVNGATRAIEILTNGNVGIGTTTPNHPLEMGSGAYVTSGGVWTDASSREYKENIRDLSYDEAKFALSSLKPTKFNYKVDKDDDYLGFIAEDVPHLVATKDRKGLSPMDIVAVLTKVVQMQQKEIEALEARLNERQ